MASHKRVSYVLPLASSPNGHKLGINGLALDQRRSTLYTAGRDGLVCAWDSTCSTDSSQRATFSQRSFKGQVQAHTHWVNDVVLAQDGSAVISASSDLTVKLWRPHSTDSSPPQTIGLHKDYVKCLASPGGHADWVASGALDHKISLWDLKEGRNTLTIDNEEDGNKAKGSVYALGCGGGVLASGGPESVVKVWDPRSGQRVTKFVGHQDIIRSVLISATGDMIVTASSDQTIKGWSVTARRCMYTLTMHNESVWSLYSEHPQLSLFYSGDRSGLVAKTDVRGTTEMDDGLCLALCQEHEGISQLIGNGEHIWTATRSSSINRWFDANIDVDTSYVDLQRHQRTTSVTSRTMSPTSPRWNNPAAGIVPPKQVPPSSILRLSNTAVFPLLPYREGDIPNSSAPSLVRQLSQGAQEPETEDTTPLYSLPDETIEGHHGLTKHIMMNDRKRVLTVDTAGDVVLWDLLQCVPVKSFGKRHIDEVATEIDQKISISTWCTVDTRLGQIAVVLEENVCFHGEFYGDELSLDNRLDFKEDQRVNLGKWMLRYLFANLIDEEIKRDGEHRASLQVKQNSDDKSSRKPNLSIQMPSSNPTSQAADSQNAFETTTPRAENAKTLPLMTPGLGIGVATPSVTERSNPLGEALQKTTSTETVENGKSSSETSRPRRSAEKPNDYFTSPAPATNSPSKPDANQKQAVASPEPPSETQTVNSPTEGEKEGPQKESGKFGKKFRNVFTVKKLGRVSMENKLSSAEEKAEESDDASKIPQPRGVVVIEDNLYGSVQKIRTGYDSTAAEGAVDNIISNIMPSLPIETPVIKPPGNTIVLIQKDDPDSGGVEDLYRGTISSVGTDTDLIEKVAPMWLGDMLLRNYWPFKELPKVSFILNPMDNLLPSISGTENVSRLNAHRMLRAKKIFGYVAERLDFVKPESKPADQFEPIKESPLDDPEKYLELYCNGQALTSQTTLNIIRTYIWKYGTDPIILYKSTGIREFTGEAEARKVAEAATAALKEKEREKEAKAAASKLDSPLPAPQEPQFLPSTLDSLKAKIR